MAQSIQEIQKRFEAAELEACLTLINEYKADGRAGVQKLILRYERLLDQLEKEKQRTQTMWQYERQYAHVDHIAGIDEVGRGPFAGPVVTAAVILPKDFDVLHIDDSKKLSHEKREVLYALIMEKATAVSIGMVHADEIDKVNILNATKAAMKAAVDNLEVRPGQLLVDAVTIPGVEMPQQAIVKGDEKSISIAAASIIAKVTRDRMMCGYDELFPGYGFSKHKGYGTPEHIRGIERLGLCPLHRRSFLKGVAIRESKWK